MAKKYPRLTEKEIEAIRYGKFIPDDCESERDVDMSIRERLLSDLEMCRLYLKNIRQFCRRHQSHALIMEAVRKALGDSPPKVKAHCRYCGAPTAPKEKGGAKEEKERRTHIEE